MKNAVLLLFVASAAAADVPCTSSNNAYHSDEGCFCTDGFLPNSYGGLPCLPIKEAKSRYCMEDNNAFWLPSKEECFCVDGHEASSDSPHHGHPCKPKVVIQEAECNKDPHSHWDGAKQDCYCDHGYEGNSKRNAAGFFHPCQKTEL